MKRLLSLLLLLFALTAQAQDSDADGKIMLTVILRHDQTLTLDEINDRLEKTGFRKALPPMASDRLLQYRHGHRTRYHAPLTPR